MSQSKFFLTSRRRFFYNAGVGAGVLLVSSMILSLYLLSAPRTHADGALFLVTPELSEHDAIEKLSREGYIRNASAFALLWNTVYTGGAIVPGGYVLSKDMNAREIARTITEPPQQRWVTLKEGMTRAEAALAFATSLEWDEVQRREFSSTLVSMQWDFFNEDARRLFTTRLNWDALEQEIFTTMATLYRAAEYDFFSGTLPPGDYLVPIAESIPRITNQFLHTMREIVAPSAHAYFSEHIDASITENIARLVREGAERLPDLIPLPAKDITVKRSGDRTILTFSTSYWNNGDGPLELIADPKTTGVSGDIDRNVYQRVYRSDGSVRDHVAGHFLWHNEHLHYHFADFVDYILESADGNDVSSEIKTKATFCVRDVEHTSAMLGGLSEDTPTYAVCGKEKQGISVGWSDTYFYTYAGQDMDISNLPSGRYRLYFHVDPFGRFDELDVSNNVSSAVFDLDVESLSATVVETLRGDEHTEQVFPHRHHPHATSTSPHTHP